MPYQAGTENVPTMATPKPPKRQPRGPSPAPTYTPTSRGGSYSGSSTSRSVPTSNPDLVSHMQPVPSYRPRYVPQVAAMPAPYHYTPPTPVVSRTQRQRYTQNKMQEQINTLIANGGSAYEISTALDAAIRQRYSFIVNTDRRQVNHAMNQGLKSFALAKQDAYDESNTDTPGMIRNQETGGVSTVFADTFHEKPKLSEIFGKAAFDPTLPNQVNTLKDFNRRTEGMPKDQLSYMGNTLQSMMYASEQDRSPMKFAKDRLRQANADFRLSQIKNAAYHRDHAASDTSGGSSQPSNLYGHQVKPTDSGGGFWGAVGNVADHVGGAIGDASNATGHFIGKAVDNVNGDVGSIPGGSAVQDGLDQAWNNDLVRSTRHTLGEATGSALMWSIDKLSRPLYATAGAWDAVGRAGDGEKSNDFLSRSFDTASKAIPGLSLATTAMGLDPSKSIKGLIHHPGRALAIPKEAGSQLVNGGIHNAHDPVMFEQVIRNNANRNPENGYLQNHVYQGMTGLALDLFGDPTNALGVGVGTRAITASKALGGSEELSKTAKGISDLLKEHDVAEIEPQAVEHMLTGGMPKRPRTVKERVAGAKAMGEGHAQLHDLMGQARKAEMAGNRAGTTSKVDTLTEQIRKAEIARDNLVQEFHLDTQVSELKNNIAKGVNKGDLPEHANQAIEDMVTTSHIQKHLGEMLKRRYKFGEATKAFEDIRSKLGLPEDADWSDVIREAGDSKAYKGRIPSFEAHQEAHEGDRAFDLLPESIRKSGLFKNPTEFDNFLGRAYAVLGYDKEHGGAVGTAFKRLEGTEKHLKGQVAKTSDEYAKQGLQSTIRHTQGKKLRVQAASLLQMIKDEALRQTGQKVFRNPEYARNMQRLIDEVDQRLAHEHMGGGTVDMHDAPASQFDRADQEHAARNFTDISPHIYPDTGEWNDSIFEADAGHYNGAQQLDRIRQFAERGLQRENTVTQEGKIKSFSNIEHSTVDLPEGLRGEHLRDYFHVNDKGEIAIAKASELTPEEHAALQNVKDAVVAERENIFSSEQAGRRARRSDELKTKATEATEQAQREHDAHVFKGAENYASRNGRGFILHVAHNGRQVKQGSTETARLVNDTDKARAEEVKNILDTARYPAGTKRPLDEQDIKKLRWLFESNGYTVPKSIDTSEKWTKFLQGDAKFFNQNAHASDEFRAYNEAVFKSLGRKAVDKPYRMAKVWSEPGQIAFNRAFKQVNKRHAFQAREALAARMDKGIKFDYDKAFKAHHEHLKTSERPIGNTREYDATRKEAAQRALEYAIKHSANGGLKSDEYHVALHPSELPDYQALKASMDAKHADEVQALKDEVNSIKELRGKAQAKKRYYNSRIKKLRAQQAVEHQALSEAQKTAVEAHQAYQRNMLTDARMRVIQSETAKQAGLKLGWGRSEAFIPAPEVLAKGADVLGGLPLIKQTREIYARAFRPPTAGMEQDLVRARNHMFGMTANIIEDHVKELESVFGPMTTDARKTALKEYLAGAKTEGADHVQRLFDDLVPYYSRQHPVGDDVLTIEKINRQLPPAYRSIALDDVTDGKDLYHSIVDGANSRLHNAHTKVRLAQQRFDRAEKANPEKHGLITKKGVYKTKNPNPFKPALQDAKNELASIRQAFDKGAVDDPYNMLWHLRIGIENAQGLMAFEHVIKESFGVRRIGQLKNGKFVATQSELSKAVERLGNKDTGWQTIDSMGNGHYFPSEIAGDVQRLVESMQPENINKLSELFDQATRAWKAVATIYNPGYWTRNSIGEILAAHMAGHNNPKDYWRSGKLIKYMTSDEGKNLDELKSHFPDLKGQQLVGDDVPKGHHVAMHMASGEPVTYEQLALAMHGEGMKTGFFNTEYERNSLVDKGMSTPGVKTAVAGHRKLRDWGENHETFLRAGHFIAAIRKSKKPFAEAAADAASEVRKYHFDYTEFTPFEKQVMLRAFPFYKWTRRAIPLFMGMMFTKPGKMLAYPKMMNSAQNLLTTNDIKDDHNGFLPNYNTPNYSGIVPSWMQDLMAYQISGDQQTGLGTFLNINTPQYDALKSGFQPQQTALAMFNPLIKTPVEQVRGKTLGDMVGQFSYDLNDPDKGNIYRINELLGAIPGARFGARAAIPQNKLDLAQLTSFGTGIGTYEDTPARQWGELQNRKGK